MPENSDVFLIDHAWTFRLSDAYNRLKEVPGLVERMSALMCVDVDLNEETVDDDDDGDGEKLTAEQIVERELCKVKNDGVHSVKWLELEELEIDDDMLVSLDLPSKFPHLLALSLCSNKLKKLETVVSVVNQFKNLRALWMKDNPILHTGDHPLEDAVLKSSPLLEIFNSLFTSKYGDWALGFCGGLYDSDNPGDGSLRTITHLDISNRGICNLMTKAFSPAEMPILSQLNTRGNPCYENSSSELLNYLRVFNNLTALEVDIPGPLGDNAVDIIEALPNLSLLNGLSTSKILESEKHIVDSMLQHRLPEWDSGDTLIDRVIAAMWLYILTYRLADEENMDETSVWLQGHMYFLEMVWAQIFLAVLEGLRLFCSALRPVTLKSVPFSKQKYVMDELGSALRHSDEANFRVSPFLYMAEGKLESAVSYSILWPTKNIQSGDECTRDFLFGIGEEKQRSSRLTAWFHTPKNYFIREFEKYSMKLRSTNFSPLPVKPPATRSLHRPDGNPLHVYTDMPYVEEFLTRPEFVFTTEPENADIIWTSMQVDEEVKSALGLNEQQYTNQFPFEACLVMKHHLSETVQKAHGAPDWLQPTYNLETHLTQLIGDYFTCQRDELDNLWILKPWNMARTIDTTVTQSLTAIIRFMETGPKICQKYIEHPSLFRGKQFDLRYIVLVRSINPLEIFLADVFWVRLANNSYSLDKRSLFEYETHFTVMNYRGRLNHMNTPEFVKEFEQEHQVNWMDIHLRVKEMIRSVFESAAAVHPGMHSPMSRAIYGVDVMVDSHYQPKLLEVTYCPDCNRACKYDTESLAGKPIKASEFFNDVFGCLFLNETTNVSPL